MFNINELLVLIQRKKSSYDFKNDPSRPDSFQNNWKNNTQDTLKLMYKRQFIFSCPAQTVANYCFGKMKPRTGEKDSDTVSTGVFTLRCFADPRNFEGDVHEITSSYDNNGEVINHKAMQVDDNGYQTGRWLIHNRYSKRLGRDTNFGWSAGCFVLSSPDLEEFGRVLRDYGVKEGDLIRGLVREIDDVGWPL